MQGEKLTQYAPVKVILGPHCLSTSLYFTLNPVQCWLMPLCLSIEHWHLAPPYLYSLLHLPGQAVPGAVSDLGLELGLLPLVAGVLVLDHERGHFPSPVSRQVLI